MQSDNKENGMIKALYTHLKQYITIFASCVQHMAGEAYVWARKGKETGGPLLGLRTHAGRFIVMLATSGGPRAQRDPAHFAMDTEYVTKLNRLLQKRFGILYFGDWHSHVLYIDHPSNGDQEHICRLARRHNIPQMVQIILTSERVTDRQANIDITKMRINTFVYHEASNGSYNRCPIKIIPYPNPIRTALADTNFLHIADGPCLRKFPFDRILYDGLEASSESDRSWQEIPSNLITELVELPDNVAKRTELQIFKSRIELSLPLPNGCHVVVMYTNNEMLPRIYSVSAVYPGTETPIDITQEVLAGSGVTSLSVIYKRAASKIKRKRAGIFFYQCGKSVSNLCRNVNIQRPTNKKIITDNSLKFQEKFENVVKKTTNSSDGREEALRAENGPSV